MGRHKRPSAAWIYAVWIAIAVAAVIAGLFMTDSPLLK